ncbi:MAG: hypothetical protein MUW56_01535 [Chryseobacterium sp.]|uniref:hypothetical protein n=1 Tax=Chryseobacterium sp. TaxID=1871047 RepID=UPI0025C2E768|nr:hypothetical protein [Chryseobacterium sp.]MCJ7932335.1 hypothetical protein [Chryseobacterium sp.]
MIPLTNQLLVKEIQLEKYVEVEVKDAMIMKDVVSIQLDSPIAIRVLVVNSTIEDFMTYHYSQLKSADP